nr:hypothetical protein [Tanacetum cinerariifolium]
FADDTLSHYKARLVANGSTQLKDLGSLNNFLGISVTRDSTWMFLSQRMYAVEILERAHMGGEAFDLFIALGGLVDVPLGGYKFTWSLSSASKINQGDNDVELVAKRTKIMNSIHDIERGKGILNDGVWIEDPIKVKDALLNHFAERFSYPCHTRLRLEVQFPNRITVEQRLDMERDITYDEVKKAVWDCGSDKSPGLDGFTFGFYRRYWRFMGSDVVAAVNHFFQYGQFPKGGVCVGSSLMLSHLFYANDVIFLGQWCDSNISTIVQVLQCFYRASGLMINLQKIKVMGIGVSSNQVEKAAYQIGCVTFTPPFSYLGVKVGGMMSRISTWNEEQFFNGMEMIEKKMVWVRWSNVLASKQKGGLGVSSFYALNRALLFKWVWRFRSQNSSLWARLIKVIHGNDGHLMRMPKTSRSSIWLDIVREVFHLKQQEASKNVSVANKISSNNFCDSFRRFPRGGAESEQFNELSSKLLCVILPQSQDRWVWSLEASGDFSVASIRKVLDDFKLRRFRLKLDEVQSFQSLAHKIMIWWNIRLMDFESYEEWLAWFLGVNIRCKHKEVLESVFYVLWWCNWRVRNGVIFGRKSPIKAIMFDEIVSWSYTWCNARSKLKFSWVDWLRNPLLISL